MPDVNALDLVLTRRTVTSAYLEDPGPNAEQIETLLTAGIRVPDHGKLTPWRFIVMDKPSREALVPQFLAHRQATEPDQDPEIRRKQAGVIANAPLCIAVVSTPREHPKIPVWEQHMSAGASVMNLMIAAHAMGFGAQWLTGWYTYDPHTKALMGVGDEEEIAAFVHIGTPQIPPQERPRPEPATLRTDLAPAR